MAAENPCSVHHNNRIPVTAELKNSGLKYGWNDRIDSLGMLVILCGIGCEGGGEYKRFEYLWE